MKVYEKLIRPILFKFDTEKVHNFSIKVLKQFQNQKIILPPTTDERLKIKCFNRTFSSPIGIAAGFDKNGEVYNSLGLLGFSFVEVGTVVHDPQTGNTKPRMYREESTKSIINHLGFPSVGIHKVYSNVWETETSNVPLGLNLSVNKMYKDIPSEISHIVNKSTYMSKYFDYIVINLSSPNTLGLRQTQSSDLLKETLSKIDKALLTKPFLLKISPDLDKNQLEEIVEVCKKNFFVSGIVACNTLPIPQQDRIVGISGRPLKSISEHTMNELSTLVEKSIKRPFTLIGVGGIEDGIDVWNRMCLGATLVQVYTSFIYSGPSFTSTVKKELISLMDQHGVETISGIIGRKDLIIKRKN